MQRFHACFACHVPTFGCGQVGCLDVFFLGRDAALVLVPQKLHERAEEVPVRPAAETTFAIIVGAGSTAQGVGKLGVHQVAVDIAPPVLLAACKDQLVVVFYQLPLLWCHGLGWWVSHARLASRLAHPTAWLAPNLTDEY